MQTAKWGPSAWKLLHYITFKAPRRPLSPAEQQVYQEFFTLIGDILPCVYCRRSYKEFIQELPIDVSSGEAMCKWLYLVHNKVNKKLDKTDIPSYREVTRRYRSHSLPLNDDTAWIFLYCIAFNSRPDDHQQQQAYQRWYYLLSYVFAWEQARSWWTKEKCSHNTWMEHVFNIEQRIDGLYDWRYQQIADMKAGKCSAQLQGCTK